MIPAPGPKIVAVVGDASIVNGTSFEGLNNLGLGGVCEADLKSTMTHLIFTYLVGRPGFVTDPVFDLSNSTIIHAHCVAATQMEGPQSRPAPLPAATLRQ